MFTLRHNFIGSLGGKDSKMHSTVLAGHFAMRLLVSYVLGVLSVLASGSGTDSQTGSFICPCITNMKSHLI